MPDASVGALLRSAWRGRDLVRALALRDIRVRYAEASMGVLWALLTPLLTVAAGVAFDALARARGAGTDGRLAGVIVTSVPWAFVTAAVAAATTCVSANMAIVSKVAFPRVVLPLSAVLAQLPDAVVAGLALGAGLVLIGTPIVATWWWGVPALLTLGVWTLALSLGLSAMGALLRDVKYIVQVLLRFGLFAVPILYSPADLGGWPGTFLRWNPLTAPLDGLRLAVVAGHDLSVPIAGASGGPPVWAPMDLVWSATAGLVGLGIAAFAFARAEPLLADAA